LLASLLCVGIAHSGLRRPLAEPEKKDALKMVAVDKDVKDHQATRAETKDDLKTETNVEAEDEDDEDDEDAINDSKFEGGPAGQVIRPGACGAGIFTPDNLGPGATYRRGRAVFVRSCGSGAGAHPRVLCESGADELFKGKNMAELFSERPDGAFCKSLKDIQKTHRDWKRAQRQAMMLGRTKEQKHAFARLENAVQGKGGYRRRRDFRRRRGSHASCHRRRCG